MSDVLRIGTRGSQLALWQANEVARRLGALGYRPEIVTIRTTGDRQQDAKPAAIGGKGVFIKELEEALAKGEVDMAVHSLKDVPAMVPPRFALASFLERADPRDAWIHASRTPIEKMPAGARIGTSAPRRRAQLRALYPDLRAEDIRGNVDTRLNKLRAGQYDGIILAGAGLTRLGLQREITSYFSIDEMVPAVGQGIIAIETASDRAQEIAAQINHPPSALAAKCERGVLQKFGDRLDCDSPVAVHATIGQGGALGVGAAALGRSAAGEGARRHTTDLAEIVILAFFAEPEGERSIRVMRKGHDPDVAIDMVYEALVAAGALEFAR